MKYVFSLAYLSVGASAATLRRATADQCCFGITVSGGAQGSLSQSSDGQNRLGPPDAAAASFCIYGDQIYDQSGRGCVLTPPTTQFQCTQGTDPTEGFSVTSSGEIQYSEDGIFFACPSSDNAASDIYQSPMPGMENCVQARLSAANETCTPKESSSSSIGPASGGIPTTRLRTTLLSSSGSVSGVTLTTSAVDVSPSPGIGTSPRITPAIATSMTSSSSSLGSNFSIASTTETFTVSSSSSIGSASGVIPKTAHSKLSSSGVTSFYLPVVPPSVPSHPPGPLKSRSRVFPSAPFMPHSVHSWTRYLPTVSWYTSAKERTSPSIYKTGTAISTKLPPPVYETSTKVSTTPKFVTSAPTNDPAAGPEPIAASYNTVTVETHAESPAMQTAHPMQMNTPRSMAKSTNTTNTTEAKQLTFTQTVQGCPALASQTETRTVVVTATVYS